MTFIAILLIILTVMVIINCAAVVLITKILEEHYDRFEIIDRTLKQKPEESETTKAIKELVKEYEEEKLKEID
jgi:uncharacterized protein YxeA